MEVDGKEGCSLVLGGAVLFTPVVIEDEDVVADEKVLVVVLVVVVEVCAERSRKTIMLAHPKLPKESVVVIVIL